MRIGIYTPVYGGSPLVGGMLNGFRQLGHDVEEFIAGHSYDYVLLFNQTSHRTDYHYPDLSQLNPYRIAFIDSAEYGFFKRLPSTYHLFYNTFASGAMTHDTKVYTEQKKLQDYLTGKSFPYFIREYLKRVSYPSSYHPIDYPLYCHSECHIQPDINNYRQRDLDLFVSWGASHPFRMNITEALRNCHTKCEISVIEERINGNVTPRMAQHQYFSRMLAAKCTVSFDGYGSSSFREMEALCRTLLFKGPLQILQRSPLVNGVSCIEYEVKTNPEETEFVSSNICEVIRESLKDVDRCFRIYQAGFNHCMHCFTEKATAQYVLDTILKHDWSTITPLNF